MSAQSILDAPAIGVDSAAPQCVRSDPEPLSADWAWGYQCGLVLIVISALLPLIRPLRTIGCANFTLKRG